MSELKSQANSEVAPLALDYFIAGVPPLGWFELEVKNLAALVDSSKEYRLTSLNPTAEVSLIGLLAYFEAFCKAQFAAIINTCPETLRNFVQRRPNATLSLRNILNTGAQVASKLGNLISEEHDFGSAKEINGLYQDLLHISPFSTKEATQYARFLSDRNLLVHHAGVYTFKYSSQRFVSRSIPGLPHWDSLVIGKKEFSRWNSYLLAMARKITRASRTALEEFVARERLELNLQQKKAIQMFD